MAEVQSNGKIFDVRLFGDDAKSRLQLRADSMGSYMLHPNGSFVGTAIGDSLAHPGVAAPGPADRPILLQAAKSFLTDPNFADLRDGFNTSMMLHGINQQLAKPGLAPK